MKSAVITPESYVDQLPPERQEAIQRLRELLRTSLPPGFEETMSCGMIGYVVPKSVYPAGYHCKPEEPLPFISLASQKNFIALYHMGIYADPGLLAWFVAEYPKYSKYKLDMGKSCIRFKRVDDIPYDLVAELAGKMTVGEWVEIYEAAFKK